MTARLSTEIKENSAYIAGGFGGNNFKFKKYYSGICLVDINNLQQQWEKL